jgi:hypothetical protein
MMMRKMRMNKKLVLGLALALVLVSGAFINANAQCLCLPHISCPGTCQPAVQAPLNATCQGAFSYGPAAPIPMGTMGGAAAG